MTNNIKYILFGLMLGAIQACQLTGEDSSLNLSKLNQNSEEPTGVVGGDTYFDALVIPYSGNDVCGTDTDQIYNVVKELNIKSNLLPEDITNLSANIPLFDSIDTPELQVSSLCDVGQGNSEGITIGQDVDVYSGNWVKQILALASGNVFKFISAFKLAQDDFTPFYTNPIEADPDYFYDFIENFGTGSSSISSKSHIPITTQVSCHGSSPEESGVILPLQENFENPAKSLGFDLFVAGTKDQIDKIIDSKGTPSLLFQLFSHNARNSGEAINIQNFIVTKISTGFNPNLESPAIEIIIPHGSSAKSYYTLMNFGQEDERSIGSVTSIDLFQSRANDDYSIVKLTGYDPKTNQNALTTISYADGQRFVSTEVIETPSVSNIHYTTNCAFSNGHGLTEIQRRRNGSVRGFSSFQLVNSLLNLFIPEIIGDSN